MPRVGVVSVASNKLKTRPRDMGWLEERHQLNERYYRGEIDVETYVRELEKIAKKERDRERRSIALMTRG